MFNRVFITCGLIAILCGCAPEEPAPKIVYDYGKDNIQSNSLTPNYHQGNVSEGVPKSWEPLSWSEKSWVAIIIHHSGTKNGNAAIFDKWHREGNHWEGVGYDFVIGNGTDSVDGEVEVTYRWREQRTGAHCGGTFGNWANKDGIGICLVGNFNQITPSSSQIQSLVRLVRFLQNRYGIPKSNVYGHGSTPGANVTDCPGRRFPMAQVKSMLDF